MCMFIMVYTIVGLPVVLYVIVGLPAVIWITEEPENL